ncbi:ABC transporter ATP-binding protein [Chloroflexota bacterium]
MVIILTKNLTKKFKDLVAVENVNLGIEKGECLGLLGPNGAGKTSLIRMITAISPPTGGEIWIKGAELNNYSRQAKAILGVVPQMDNLDEDLTVLQNLMTFARYFNIPRRDAHLRSMEVLSLFELRNKKDSWIRELSGGMKRRLLFARGLINMPEILVLDEPSIGLDPQARYLVWNKLTEMKSQGITLLLCTQNMEEAAILCNRVAIMHHGKILSLDTPQKLISKYAGNEVWEIDADPSGKPLATEELTKRGLDFEKVDDKIYAFHIENEASVNGLASSPGRLRRRQATLEDVFFRLTGRSLVE